MSVYEFTKENWEKAGKPQRAAFANGKWSDTRSQAWFTGLEYRWPIPYPEVNIQHNETALTVQKGGNHYKDFKIQPVEYIEANDLSFLEGCIIKYVSRHTKKNGREDIEKAIHCCQLILQMRYGN